jgi:phosphoglycolate phosphatase-like HAD superfamily hydrolase
MSRPPAAILDVDGTLVDSNYQHALAWYRAFAMHGLTLPVWRCHRAIGMGGDQLVPFLAGEGFDAEHGDEVRAAEHVLFEQMIGEVRAFEGARGLLEDLKARGSRIVLASSAKSADIAHFIDLLDARELADGWTDSSSVQRTKPAPDLVRAALDIVDGGPGVMVGDSTWDVQAARKLKVPTVCVRTGGFGADELREAGAVAVFDSIAELRERLSDTPFG